jgi:hypothetical protein
MHQIQAQNVTFSIGGRSTGGEESIVGFELGDVSFEGAKIKRLRGEEDSEF